MVQLLEFVFVIQEPVLPEQFVNAKSKIRLPKNSSLICILLDSQFSSGDLIQLYCSWYPKYFFYFSLVLAVSFVLSPRCYGCLWSKQLNI